MTDGCKKLSTKEPSMRVRACWWDRLTRLRENRGVQSRITSKFGAGRITRFGSSKYFAAPCDRLPYTPIISCHFYPLLLSTWFALRPLIPTGPNQLFSRKLTGLTITTSLCSPCWASSSGPKISRFYLERKMLPRSPTLGFTPRYGLLTYF
jgi:hypothetical protein